VADKEVADKRAAEEAATKAAAAEDVAGKTADEAAGAAGGSPAPGQAPSAAGAKRAATPSGSTPPAKCPYRGVWKPRFVEFSLPLFSLFLWGFILLLPFLSRSSPSGATTATGMAVADAAVRVVLGLAPISEPWTPEGVPEDMVESEGEPEVALEPVPEVVQEGAMIAVRVVAAPPPSHGLPPVRE
jgi:hypothetical protein